MTRELMPLHTVSPKANPPRLPNGSDLIRRTGVLPTLMAAADHAGIALPDDALAQYAEARRIRWAPITDADPTRRITSDLATGNLTLAEADAAVAAALSGNAKSIRAKQLQTRTRAAEDLYVDAAMTIRDAAPDLITTARARLADVLAAQAAADHLNPALHDAYEALHAFAKALRWATGSCQAPDDFWRFNKPEAVYAWRVDEADRRIRARDPRPRLGLTPTPYGDVMTVGGIANPTVYDAATHPEWEPTIVLAAEVIANADRIDHAQRSPESAPDDAA